MKIKTQLGNQISRNYCNKVDDGIVVRATGFKKAVLCYFENIIN